MHVQISSPVIQADQVSDQDLYVVHTTDDQTAEPIHEIMDEVQTVDGDLVFSNDEFSLYTIIETEADPVVAFVYHLQRGDDVTLDKDISFTEDDLLAAFNSLQDSHPGEGFYNGGAWHKVITIMM